MAAIGKIKASRVNRVDPDTYVGESGILFFNFANGVIRRSDGNTPGGIPIPYTIASNNTIGGIKAGPGVVVSDDGTLFIDTSGLPLSFGDFTANTNVLSVINSDEDMILQTTGSAEIQLVGNIGFYKPDGIPPSVSNRYFYAQEDGQIFIYVDATDPDFAAVDIIGSTTGNTIAPGQPGAMLHLTGQVNLPSRFYQDGNGNYAAYVARRWNGNVANPTQVLAGQDILRINSTAATDAGLGNVAMAQISMTALEDQTITAQGSSITFTVTPLGQPVTDRVAVANITVANGITATKFNTTGNVNANFYNGNVVLSAGTATVPPLKFTAGTILSNVVPGAMNYDGRVFYLTPQDSERGIVPAEQWLVLNSNRAMTFSTTTAQSMFGQGVHLSANTRYYFFVKATLSRTTGDNNTTLNLGWTGNAGLESIIYSVQSRVGAEGTVGTQSTVERTIKSNFATVQAVTAISNPPDTMAILVSGFVNTNATPGYLAPTITWSGATAAGAVSVFEGSSYRIYPVSATGANTNVGSWTSV